MPARSESQDWNDYWLDTSNQASYNANHNSVLEHFWNERFGECFQLTDAATVLDLACGSGIVTSYSQQQAHKLNTHLVNICLDFSTKALEATKKSSPETHLVIGDVNNLPIQPQSIDLVCSQFGLEYIGGNAFLQAADTVKIGGRFIAIIHQQNSIIFNECQKNQQALSQLIDSSLLENSLLAFEAGFSAIHHQGSSSAFKRADKQLANSVAQVQDIFKRFTPQVCNNFIYQLYQDMGKMYQRMQHYSAKEVLTWLEAIKQRSEAYHQRMIAMTESAMSQEQFAALVTQVNQRGLHVKFQNSIEDKSSKQAIAWSLIAEK